MDVNKVNKIKNVLKSPISEYKNIVCNFDVKSSDFFENAENSYNEIEQLIFRVALKKIRNLKNITQKNLAELTGKKAITIQGYENDRLKISAEFMYLVIKKINLTKEEFINNILFSSELFSILYTFVKTLVHENKRESENEIFDFIEKTFSNTIIQLFDSDEENKNNTNFIINKENLINNSQKIYELLNSHVSESFQKQILEEIEKELNIENRKEKHRLSSKISQDIFAILKTDVKEYFKIYSGKNLTSEEIKKLHEDILKYTMFLLSDLATQK